VVEPVRSILARGRRYSAADYADALTQLRALAQRAAPMWLDIDVLLLPTAPTVYSVKQVLADPIQLNSRLGTYTNFVNLLDLSGLAVPAAIRADGMPSGVTLLAPAGHDSLLASIGRAFHADTGLPLGALGLPQPPLPVITPAPAADEIVIAAVGAHLTGMPLNGELKALGARLLEATSTAPDYRLYALAGSKPPKPGLLRVAADKGSAIAVEIWALRAESFGRFVAAVPSPLSIGTLRLADGRTVKGFLVEADAVGGALDISSFGGWRNYLAQTSVPAA